jgi:hypothetical protein
MVAQNISVRGSEGLDLGKDNGREDECGQKSYDGKGAHGAQYGADPRDRQGKGGELSNFSGAKKMGSS